LDLLKLHRLASIDFGFWGTGADYAPFSQALGILSTS
jgi:hypothetical protein